MLQVARPAFVSMVAQAKAGAPREVCGVLAGTDDGERRVAAVYRVANVADAPRSNYRMDPEEQLSAVETVESSGLDVVGFYHSHPAGPAGPSATDEARATWPDHVYAIVSLAGDEPELGAWEWTGEAFEGVEVHVEG